MHACLDLCTFETMHFPSAWRDALLRMSLHARVLALAGAGAVPVMEVHG